MPKLSDQVMVSAPGRGGKGERGRRKGGGGRGKWERGGGSGEGERGRGKGGGGKGERERGRGKEEGERGRGGRGGEIETGHNGQERKREDIPVSVIPVTVETQHSHVIAKELWKCVQLLTESQWLQLSCACVSYTQ